jgi:hypothetical protein
MTSHIRILPALLLLAIPACGDDGNNTSTNVDDTTNATPPGNETTETPTTEPDTSTGPDETTEPDTSTGPDETTETPTSTNPIDPCDMCGANASCENDECVCDEGFEGDGVDCADIDECSGPEAECDVDAACSNTPGGYDCTCNAGYKGNGFECENVDECNEDLDDCDPNATCTDQDGTFKCECNEGYMGDGKMCMGSKEFGEACEFNSDCASGLCLTDPNMCTIDCTQTVANDCGAQGVTGLCIQAGDNIFVCAGELTFGNDVNDDEIMENGDSLTRPFQTTTDQDLFLINFVDAGTFNIIATPDADDTLSLQVFGPDGNSVGTDMSPAAGQFAGLAVEVPAAAVPLVAFAVVKNTGATNGDYMISVMPQ